MVDTMPSQLMLLPDAPAPSPTNGEVTESETQAAIQQDGEDHSPLEPGEISTLDIKQEERAHDSTSALNPFLRYHLDHLVSNEHGDRNASPFAQVTVAANPVTPFGHPEGVISNIPRPTTAIQRRNHARLSDIVVRLQNFNGTVTELLAIASVQQQLDTAFADLDRAKNQLKDVLRQFEQGAMGSPTS